MDESLPIGEALRLIRTRQGLTQQAASKLGGAADFRTLSHWETGRKVPSLRLLVPYLHSLGLDLVDLQAALDQVQGQPAALTSERLATTVENLAGTVERQAAELDGLRAWVAALKGGA